MDGGLRCVIVSHSIWMNEVWVHKILEINLKAMTMLYVIFVFR